MDTRGHMHNNIATNTSKLKSTYADITSTYADITSDTVTNTSQLKSTYADIMSKSICIRTS